MGDEGFEQDADFPSKQQISALPGAESGAVGAPADLDLSRVIAAWPTLPALVRDEIARKVEPHCPVWARHDSRDSVAHRNPSPRLES
jgi:hypothetical protein